MNDAPATKDEGAADQDQSSRPREERLRPPSKADRVRAQLALRYRADCSDFDDAVRAGIVAGHLAGCCGRYAVCDRRRS